MKAFSTLIFFLLTAFGFGQALSVNFKVDQFGYRSKATKVAIIASAQNGFNASEKYTPGALIQVRKNSDNSVVFSAAPTAWKAGQTHQQSGDKVWWFDFSALQIPDEYHLYDPSTNKKSYSFAINSGVYQDVLKQAVRMFFYQRCNFAKQTPFVNVKWTDGASHTQDSVCRAIGDKNNASTAKDLRGGWYDAGDMNKYTNFTYQPIHQLLAAYEENPNAFSDDYNIPESGNGIPDLLDELKWELDWLQKMQLDNGSVLCKVAVTDYQGASPASADLSPRYYGPALASSTRIVASNFAYASLIYRSTGIPAMVQYADTLLARAEKAWNWIVANPATSNYNNAGFASANPENDSYNQDAIRTCAAVYLYAATKKTSYKSYFESNYTQLHPYAWTFWYPFEAIYCDAMLYYTKLPGINTTVASNIKNNCINAINNPNGEVLAPYLNQIDAYRAFLKDNDYVWGSNQIKANNGTLLYNMLQYKLSPENTTNYQIAAEDYIHFIHGANPLNQAMLSNMGAFGAEKSVNEIYHVWFGDGTKYDNAQTSTNGPPPGYLVGGFNPTYTPDGSYSGPRLAPPLDQPVQKSFKDWNTSYPENSWQLTEPAIYYQAAYIKLLSKFVEAPETNASCDRPTNIETRNITATSATLSWTKTQASSYLIRYMQTGQTWIYSNSADSLLNLTNLLPNTDYNWQVAGICNSDTSLYSDTSYFATLPLPCLAPTQLQTLTINDSSASLHWNTTPNASGYLVNYTLTGQPWKDSLVSDTSIILLGLLPDTLYTWTVSSICQNNDTSAFSNAESFRTIKTTVPCRAPNQLQTLAISDTSASLHWNLISNAVQYAIRIKKPSDTTWQNFTSLDTTSTLNLLKAASLYSWEVLSICENDSSNWSVTSSFQTNNSPVGLVDIAKLTGFVYPNPSSFEFSLQHEDFFASASIYALNGELITYLPATDLQKPFGGNLNPGLYLLVLKLKSGGSYPIKISKVTY